MRMIVCLLKRLYYSIYPQFGEENGNSYQVIPDCFSSHDDAIDRVNAMTEMIVRGRADSFLVPEQNKPFVMIKYLDPYKQIEARIDALFTLEQMLEQITIRQQAVTRNNLVIKQ